MVIFHSSVSLPKGNFPINTYFDQVAPQTPLRCLDRLDQAAARTSGKIHEAEYGLIISYVYIEKLVVQTYFRWFDLRLIDISS